MNPAMQKDFMRGLHNYISDLHDAQTKEKEQLRVDKELGKIRKAFKEAKLSGYDKRKYVSKLMYTYMFGYDVDFGYTECLSLLSSPKYTEKSTGYLAMQLFLNEKHEMIPLIVNSLQDDLRSPVEVNQGLALQTIGSIGGADMSEVLAPVVCNILAKSQNPSIKKKAALCFLRLLRKCPSVLQLDASIPKKFIMVLDDFNLSLVNCALAVLIEIAPLDLGAVESAVPKVLKVLTKILEKSYQREFTYHSIVHPWTQVNCLKFLQVCMPTGTKDVSVLVKVLRRIIGNTEFARGASENQKNAQLSVIFEAVKLIVSLDFDDELTKSATKLLCKFISARESNVRYLALEALELVTKTDAAALLAPCLDTIFASLRDPDISIRRRALDLVYAMTDKNNAGRVIAELLDYLETADLLIREELVLKTAILAERFSVSYRQYVDTVITLVSLAGDYVSDDIWFRVVKVVTNNEEVQAYAARTVFQALGKKTWHECLVKVGGYLLGEFGHLIAEEPGLSPSAQFELLKARFPMVGAETRALLLTSYCKFVNVWPELRGAVRAALQEHASEIDTEIQQRAVEYLQLTLPNAEELLASVMDSMPLWEGEDAVLPCAVPGASDAADTDTGAVGNASAAPSGGLGADLLGLGAGASGAGAVSKPISTESLVDDLLGLSVPGASSGGAVPSSGDLLGALGASVSAAPSTPCSGGDLLGVGAGVGATSTGSVTVDAEPAHMSAATLVSSGSAVSGVAGVSGSAADVQRHKGLWRRLCAVNEGLLYQDGDVQVGLRAEYGGARGKMMLYYGNLRGDALTGFRTALTDVPDGLALSAGPCADSVGAKAQVQQPFLVECRDSFRGYPKIRVEFAAGGCARCVVLDLPVVLSKFFAPRRGLNGPDFFAKWKAFKNEAAELFPSRVPIDVAFLAKLFAQGFNMSVLENVDPVKTNFVLGANFASQKTPEEIVLVRLETNAEHRMFRFTVHTTSDRASACVKDLFVAQLGKEAQ